MAHHSIDFWLTTEDLPDPNNRVQLKGGPIQLSYTENNGRASPLETETQTHAEPCRRHPPPLRKHRLFRKEDSIGGVGHQNGTVRFGKDPKTSALDIHCKAHDLDNLYVVDGGFFVSSSAVNPTLTIIANALRVGDHLLERINQ